MKVLVTGREGQLARSLFEQGGASGIEVVLAGRPELDLADEKTVMGTIARERPDVVVNAAAFTAVDKAENEPAAANAVNADGAEHVAQACDTNSIPLIHVSTDYVFDGTMDRPYREDDPTSPINVYGFSKLDGERRVAKACAKHVVLRSAWVYSPWGSNFVKTMLRLASIRPSISVVDDQKGSPTYAPHLAAVILKIAAHAEASPANMPWGTYHAAGAGETSWFGFAREIFRLSAAHEMAAADVIPILTADYPTPARRPANSRLNCDKLRNLLNLELPDWRLGARDCVARIAASMQPREDQTIVGDA